MQEEPEDGRLTDWVKGRLKAGCTCDEITETLLGYGYGTQDALDLIKRAQDETHNEQDDIVQMKKLADNFGDEFKHYDLRDHLREHEYALMNPLNFVGVIGSDDKVSSKVIIFVVLNLCVFSFFRSSIRFISGGSFLDFLVNFVSDIIFYTALFLVFGYVINRLLRFLNGRGSLYDTLTVFAYSLSVVVFAPLPYLWIVAAAYGYVMMIYNLSIAHNILKKNVLVALAVPTFIVVMIAALMYALI